MAPPLLLLRWLHAGAGARAEEEVGDRAVASASALEAAIATRARETRSEVGMPSKATRERARAAAASTNSKERGPAEQLLMLSEKKSSSPCERGRRTAESRIAHRQV